ncbi:hypothetical protein BGW36DRAFT_358912 [Talaromyces proteolyticus]|uniref:Uncharacterized protein n=1 Tax=Talaromyces proteolyticus TaxID=1131652 RepID=A0AAD4KQG9_9EURO|nr:uncharacterized protein BGW36DRAFT_358912 [Talaromyces proteolyticus]KAH8697100.1 hypothetical protein BGW36DRAFT_358912 [Talaromyces proteolyticus]
MSNSTFWTEESEAGQDNTFTHIYVTYASCHVDGHITKGKKNKISRAKVEWDLIHCVHRDDNLPLSLKVACTSWVRIVFFELHSECVYGQLTTENNLQILHSDKFEPLWHEYKLKNDLSAQSVQRATPGYDVLQQCLCSPSTTLGGFSGPQSAFETVSKGAKAQGVKASSFRSQGTATGTSIPNGDFLFSGKPTKTRRTSFEGRAKRKPPPPASKKRSAQQNSRKSPISKSKNAFGKKKQPMRVGVVSTPSVPNPRIPAFSPKEMVKNTVLYEQPTTPVLRRALTGKEAYDEAMANLSDDIVIHGPSSGSEFSEDEESEEE